MEFTRTHMIGYLLLFWYQKIFCVLFFPGEKLSL